MIIALSWTKIQTKSTWKWWNKKTLYVWEINFIYLAVGLNYHSSSQLPCHSERLGGQKIGLSGSVSGGHRIIESSKLKGLVIIKRILSSVHHLLNELLLA